MKGRRILMSGLALGLLMALAVGLGQAQGREPDNELPPEGTNGLINVEDTVTSDIPIQGRLTDAAGNPVPDGTYSITFRLYDAEVGGTLLCEDTDTPTVTKGLFTALMGYCTASDIDGRELWLGIQVEGDEEMTPRQRIGPVPYARSLRPGAVISDTTSYDGIAPQQSHCPLSCSSPFSRATTALSGWRTTVLMGATSLRRAIPPSGNRPSTRRGPNHGFFGPIQCHEGSEQMGRSRLYATTSVLILSALFLAGCGGAPAQPTATRTPALTSTTPTAEAPLSMPTPDFEFVASIPDAVGTWYWPEEDLYLRFYEDGMLHHAHGCDDDPYAVYEYWFEGPRMVVRTVSVSGVSHCGDVIGIYEVRLFANYGIEIVPVEDGCPPRRRDMAAMYEAVR